MPLDWPHHQWVYTIAPAGGLNSNLLDLIKWLKLHLGQKYYKQKNLISQENIRFMHSPIIAAGQGVWGEKRYYCQGWVYSMYQPHPIIWHNGGTSGMKSIMAMIPKANVGIIILCNLYEPLLPEALTRFFFDLWFDKASRNWSQELLEMQEASVQVLQKPDAPYTPPRPLRYYTGTYVNNLYGRAIVTRAHNSLIVLVGPQEINLKLKHWGGDTFVLFWPGVLTTGAGVQFYANKNGRVDRLEIAGMDDDLAGCFTRNH